MLVQKKLNVTLRKRKYNDIDQNNLARKINFNSQSSDENQKFSKCFKQTKFRKDFSLEKLKQCFSVSVPKKITCRNEEMQIIRQFIFKNIENKTGGSLYVSGLPGTGKTAALQIILNATKTEYKWLTTIYINCMNIMHSNDIFSKISSEFKKNVMNNKKYDILKHIRNEISKKSKLLILDEIDQLYSKNQNVLYTLFELSGFPNSKLILIGVANALYFTDQMLPYLRFDSSCYPQLLNFPPYTKDDIIKIIKERLSAVPEASSVFKSDAVSFVATKVSAVTGDLRRAFDICTRAVQLAEEAEEMKILQVSNKDNTSFTSSVAIDVKLILEVYKEIEQAAGLQAFNQNLPLLHQCTIAVLLLITKREQTKEIKIAKWQEIYQKLKSKQHLPEISNSEFLNICMLMEDRGIISIKKCKEIRMSKVLLRFNEEEVEQILQDKTLFTCILKSDYVF